MNTIYRYQLNVEDEQIIVTHKDAIILKVGIQNDFPWIWAVVDTHAPLEERTIVIKGEGQPITVSELARLKYLDSFQQDVFVWHVFEVVS